MTEADIYPLLQHLAGGNVYPYVVPLDPNGQPAIAPPWVVFSFISQRSADVLAGEAETANSLQIDVYSPTISRARSIRTDAAAALAPLGPAEFLRLQSFDPASALYRATLEVSLID